MRIKKRLVGVALAGVALMTAALSTACGGSSGSVQESPAPSDSIGAAPDAGWTGIDPLMGRGDVEKVRGGFMFAEGPVWIASKGMLLFTDIPADTIHQLQPPTAVTVFRMPSGKSNGLGLDAQGRLIASEHDNRRVSRTLADGTVVTVADRWQGKRLNSPNDNITRSDGTIYFIDPPYGI
ncbi:MAG: SMP-30/gluconolactonase/LRE family protein, partial [Actinomycetota bacterium]|nr:SMP-30/gluconolactonase/LRE family protein [Actinomycetota bacterium]